MLRRIFHDICPFILIGTTEVENNEAGFVCRMLFAAATTIGSNSLLLRFFIFDDDDDPSPDAPSADCGPSELEVGPEVAIPFEGFELDKDSAVIAASFAATAASSALFENGLGEFSSAKSYSGEG